MVIKFIFLYSQTNYCKYTVLYFPESSVVIQDATIEKFHTTFDFKDPLISVKETSFGDVQRNEIHLLKQELEYTKKIYEELKEKQKKEQVKSEERKRRSRRT